MPSESGLCHLLSLPRELREQIYNHVLIVNVPDSAPWVGLQPTRVSSNTAQIQQKQSPIVTLAPPRLAMQVNPQVDQEPISSSLRSEPLCFTPVQIQSDSDSDSGPSSNASPEPQSCLSILAISNLLPAQHLQLLTRKAFARIPQIHLPSPPPRNRLNPLRFPSELKLLFRSTALVAESAPLAETDVYLCERLVFPWTQRRRRACFVYPEDLCHAGIFGGGGVDL